MNALNRLALKCKIKKDQAIDKAVETMKKPMKGATSVEYFLIIALVAALIIFVFVKVLGPVIRDKMKSVGEEISNSGGISSYE